MAAKKDNKSEDKKSSKIASEEVILMNAPETKKELPKETASSKKEKEYALNLGSVYFGFLALLVIYLIIASTGPSSVALFKLWPLLIVLAILSLFKVEQRGVGKRCAATLLVFVIFIASASVALKGGSILAIEMSEEESSKELVVGQEFTNITSEIVGSVEITEGATTSISVSGNRTLVDHMDAKVKNGVLYLSYTESLWDLFLPEEARVSVTIISPEVEVVRAKGKEDVTITGVEGETITLILQGTGTLTGEEITATDLYVELPGQGVASLSGTALNQYVFLGGVVDYDAEMLTTSYTGVRLEGEGDVVISVDDELSATINGKGTVVYHGDPEIVNTASEEGVIKYGAEVELEEIQE